MSVQQESVLINILVYVYDAHQHVLHFLSLRDLLIYAATCKDVRIAVEQFTEKEYNIETCLSRFLLAKDVYTFREVQRMTNTIIAGSLALQFFARLNFPSSDMDLFTSSKEAQFMCRGLELLGCVAKGKDGNRTSSMSLLDEAWKAQFLPGGTRTRYSLRGILTVVQFVSPTGRRVQVIVTTIPPVEVLMGYHSTHVMNFITSTHAYSLYGWETFDLGLALYTSHYHRNLPKIVAKYERRGWEALTNGSEAADRMAFKPMSRQVNDHLTWRLKLKANYTEGFRKTLPDGKEDKKERALGWSLAFDILGFPELKPCVVTPLPILAPL
ncbi:hypothetical protein EYR36_007789 [Pleurotus pulmonarius]|nr:hypothetical protein EYR36_007789 [Pleurotus pulmonarius]